jgi:pimeloyl-ACP methyl ester carboxylesterase
MERRSFFRTFAAVSLGALLQGSFRGSAQAQDNTQDAAAAPGHDSGTSQFRPGSTIVLVHGAWADGSCWSNVVLPLEQRGLQVICAPIPMTSLTNDAIALSWALERTHGPVILVGHAYSGAVIAAVRDDRVKSLVYISALAPDQGETVAKVFYLNPNSPEAPKMVPDSHGYVWLPENAFHRALAQKASPDQARIAAAVQRPIAVQCIQEPAPAPAWKTRPSWYLVAEEDRMINPKSQRFMAKRMGAKIRPHPVDHTSMYADPQVVVDVILEAAHATLSR